jgi:hypothetical protein
MAKRVVALTLAGPPAAASHWSGSAMATAAGISVSSVQRIWRAHGLQPHRVRQFKLSNDPQFAAKLHEIVGLYVDGREHLAANTTILRVKTDHDFNKCKEATIARRVPALCRSAPARPLEDDDLRRRAQGDRDDCADGPRRTHGWLGLRGLRNASPRADTQVRRHRGDGQSRSTQASRRRCRNRGGRCPASLSAALFARPHPIEMAFAKLKAALRKAAARSIEALLDAIPVALAAFTTQVCLNFFTAADYDGS